MDDNELDPKEEEEFKVGASLPNDDLVDDEDEPVEEELDADPLLGKKGKSTEDDISDDDSLDALADAEFDEDDEPYDDVDHW